VNHEMQWSGKDPNEVFAKEELLGEGAYGAVYRAVHRETDMVIAIKELPNLVNQVELQKEIDILKKVDIPTSAGLDQYHDRFLFLKKASPFLFHLFHYSSALTRISCATMGRANWPTHSGCALGFIHFCRTCVLIGQGTDSDGLLRYWQREGHD